MSSGDSKATRPIGEVLDRFAVGADASMRDVLACIEKNGEGVAVIVSGAGKFLGLVTDGDIRRAILANVDFEQPVSGFLDGKATGTPPLTAPDGTRHAELCLIMDEHLVRHLPIVDDAGKFVGLGLMSEISRDPDPELPLRAVVMAGGFGQRLRPLTRDTPKPLLPVGEKPVIEHIIEKLRLSGIRKISITTHYQAEQIRDYFGDGSDWGVALDYTHEDEPLGTAGALALITDSGEPLVVINGDILTTVDFRAMLEFHKETGAELTVGVRKYDFTVPFGVIEADGARVTKLEEKPSTALFINAGVYLLEPALLSQIPTGRQFHMTDLIEALLEDDRPVSSFPIHEYWTDIGQLKDYVQAQSDARGGKLG
ncbi:MAG: nucleotidyltransferase family protein [Alphaproteobacteria bacterium]